MMAAGLKIQESRDVNPYCRYRRWYARENPKAPEREYSETGALPVLIHCSLTSGVQRRDGCRLLGVQG